MPDGARPGPAAPGPGPVSQPVRPGPGKPVAAVPGDGERGK